MVERSPLFDADLIDRERVLAALDSDIDILPRATFGFLFTFLAACCFFDEQSALGDTAARAGITDKR